MISWQNLIAALASGIKKVQREHCQERRRPLGALGPAPRDPRGAHGAPWGPQGVRWATLGPVGAPWALSAPLGPVGLLEPHVPCYGCSINSKTCKKCAFSARWVQHKLENLSEINIFPGPLVPVPGPWSLVPGPCPWSRALVPGPGPWSQALGPGPKGPKGPKWRP